MSKRQHANLHHWRLGADALEALCGTRLYICPLCLREFREDQAIAGLTREDVPPDKLGGRRMFLTCKECNSRGGAQVDHHAIIEDRARRFAANQNYGRLSGYMSFAGLEVAAELRKENNVNIMNVLPQCNRQIR